MSSNGRYLSRYFRCLLLLAGLATIGLNGIADAKKTTTDANNNNNKKKKKKKDASDGIIITPKHLEMCQGEEPMQRNKRSSQKIRHLKWIIEASGEGVVLFSTSSQHKAACWIIYKDRKQSRNRSKTMLLQRYALAVLHFGSQQASTPLGPTTTNASTSTWDWSMAVDVPAKVAARNGYWMSTKKHECSWYGVQCQHWLWPRSSVVTGIDIAFMKVDGFIPRELALLASLRELDLHANDLQGVLPHKLLDGLHQLETLRLQMNGFFGSLHKEIVGLKNLKHLSLFGNYMAGTLPTELATLTKLEHIDIQANNFAGSIPSEYGKLSSLRFFDVHDNDLVGSMPKEICQLVRKKKKNQVQLTADCLGPVQEMECPCCTICCRGLPDPRCVDMATGEELSMATLTRSR